MKKVLFWLSGVAVGFVGGIYCILHGQYTLTGFKRDIVCAIEKLLYGYTDSYRFVREYTWKKGTYYNGYNSYNDYAKRNK